MSKEIKGKDPAILLYTSDFLTGTMFMTNEQVGLYVRLLCAQHQHGGYIDTNVLRSQCDSITGGNVVYAKFNHDSIGSYNERLKKEMQIRKEKGLKAAESVKKRWEKVKNKHTYESNTNVLRSEGESVNENVNKDENVSEYEIIEYPAFSDFWDMYDKKRGDVGKIKSKWSKLTQSEKEAIIDYLPAYIANTPDKKFRKDPLTFLNNKSWNDEIITENKPGRKPIAKLEISDFD